MVIKCYISFGLLCQSHDALSPPMSRFRSSHTQPMGVAIASICFTFVIKYGLEPLVARPYGGPTRTAHTFHPPRVAIT